MEESDDDLIGTTETAEILGLERSTIARRVQMGQMGYAGRLAGKRGAYLFRRRDVLRLREELAR
jgi:Helix-turn-helix domain